MSGMKSKTSFFRALEHLDYSDDSQDDEDSLERLLAHSKPTEVLNSTAALSNPEPIALTRANTAPSSSYTNKEPREEVSAHDAHPRRRLQPLESNLRTVKRSQTTGTMPSTTSALTKGGPALKKRRTNSIIKLVPEEQRIFKELVFCETFFIICLLSLFSLTDFPNQSSSRIMISLLLADCASSEHGNTVLTGRWIGQKTSHMWLWIRIYSIPISSNTSKSTHFLLVCFTHD